MACEIEVDLPTSRRGINKFMANPEAYVCSQLRRRQVEVNERRLTPEEAMRFNKAKDTEVRNFIAAECFQLAKDKFP